METLRSRRTMSTKLDARRTPSPPRPMSILSLLTTTPSVSPSAHGRRQQRSPSLDSLPALSASSPAPSSFYQASSPPAYTPPDSPIRASATTTSPSSHRQLVQHPHQHGSPHSKTRIKRCDDTTGLQLLLLALEAEESSFFYPTYTEREDANTLTHVVKVEPEHESHLVSLPSPSYVILLLLCCVSGVPNTY